MPRMGRDYASGRNYDLGPDQRRDVSLLSPYLRRRLLTEKEVVGEALQAHSAKACEKFVQEVFWRTYFKGWLERRPEAWRAYQQGLAYDLRRLEEDGHLARHVAAATEGRTGIDPFDAWAKELVETGYVHNHARMWFASIWIFTLNLPWRLGADFYLRHLVDGDPASNTLSWRWVAGLHTRGKTYQAQAWNIDKFTRGRFQLPERALAGDCEALVEDIDLPLQPVPEVAPPDPAKRSALLVTVEDCRPEDPDLGLDLGGFVAAATFRATEGRSPGLVSEDVVAFDDGALADAAARLAAAGGPEAAARTTVDGLVEWAVASGAEQIVTPYVPVGPVRSALDAANAELAPRGISIAMVRRSWDDRVWPYATAGYFKVKSKIGQVVHRELGY